MNKVFIDGSAGTTGLRIFERLSLRKDIELITLPEELRKDSFARKDAINSADIVFLCLPDAAAKEAVAMVENKNTCIQEDCKSRLPCKWIHLIDCAACGMRNPGQECESDMLFPDRLFRRRKEDDRSV